MDSNLIGQESNFTLHIITQIIFSCTGLIFYLISYILLAFYFKYPTLIKKEIFTFIFLYSLKLLLEVIFSTSNICYIICYLIGIIAFYFLITFVNKSLTSKKLSDNSINFELIHKHYIFLTYIICTLPIIQIYSLSEKYVLADNLIKIIVIVFIYRYLKSKINALIEHLKEKKVTNTTIPDIYLPYMRAYYYYTTFNSVNLIFFDSFILIICSYSLNIIYILLKIKFLMYATTICETLSKFFFIFGCLMLFYSLNKQYFGIGKTEEEGNISNFTVIDVDIQQEEKEENSGFTIRKKKDKKNQKNKDEDSYMKIEGDETKELEKDKEKENNIKGMEETESLNN